MPKRIQIFSRLSWRLCVLSSLLLLHCSAPVPSDVQDASSSSASTIQDVSSSEIRRVVVIHFDTTRVDDLGCYGGAAQTPNLDALAARGMRYTNAITCVPFTTPSIATFMTGAYPKDHKVKDIRGRLGDHLPTLMEVLREKGFRTAGIESNRLLYGKRSIPRDGETHNGSFGHGFDEFTHVLGDKKYKANAPAASLEESCSAEVTEKAIDFVKAQGNDPFFLWMLYFSPHKPYRPPENFVTPYLKHPAVLEKVKGHETRRWTKKGKELLNGEIPREDATHVAGTAEMISRHLGEVAAVDQSLSALFDVLNSLEGKTLLIVLADHGESLGDADYWYDHGNNLRHPCMNVPLIIQCDGVVPVGVSHALTDNTDIAPTILELLGIDKDEMRGAGKSLIPSFTQTDPWPDRFVPMQSNMRDWKRGARSAHYSLQCQYDKVTGELGTAVLYDHRKDPKETTDIAKDEAKVTKRHLDFVREFYDIAQPPAQIEEIPLDPEREEALRSLGYIE